MSPFAMPGWVGLVEAAGVLAAFVVWLLVVDERRAFLRPAVAVGGGVLLVFGAAQRVSALAQATFVLGAPFSDRSTDRLLSVLLLAGGAAAGLVAATHGPGPDDVPDDDVEEEQAEERVPAYAAPARAWSSTEVLGDAPHHDGAPPPPPEPRLDLGSLLSRGVAVPLLALAVALTLPLTALSGLTARSAGEGSVDLQPSHYAYYLLTGLIVGAALLGAALWLDVWERTLVGAAFVVAAVGVVVVAAWPETFANEYWSYFGYGLGAGLAAPALVRVLRRLRAPGRVSTIAGAFAGLLLVAALGYATVRATYSSYRSSTFVSDVEG